MLTKATTKKKEKSESEDVEKAASVLGKASSSLESSVEKAFVAAVEKKGIALEKITFRDICESNQSSFGQSGSARRRSLSKRWYDIKQLSAKNYSKLLQKYSIVPGPYTFARLKEAENKEEELPIAPEAKTETTETIAEVKTLPIEEFDSVSDESEDSDDSATSILDILTQTFRTLKVADKTMSAPVNNVVTSPTPSINFSSLVASPLVKAIVVSNTGMSSIKPPSDDKVFSTLNFFLQNGSQELPFISMVRPGYPEESNPFCITPFEDKEVGRNLHSGYHIRLSVEVMDYQEYKMFVPGPYEFPHLLPLLGRVVVVKGPSLPYSFRSWHFYHRQRKISCEKTIAAHKKLDGQIGANRERQSHYRIIVFPEGVTLDNSILSENNFDVDVKTNGTNLAASDADFDNPTARKINCMALWWQIVEGVGEKAGKSPTSRTLDVADLMD